jgi:hypothetical protein
MTVVFSPQIIFQDNVRVEKNGSDIALQAQVLSGGRFPKTGTDEHPQIQDWDTTKQLWPLPRRR